ncbi:hypothetical protein C7M84_022232, partial [Penaeus vannamei]
FFFLLSLYFPYSLFLSFFSPFFLFLLSFLLSFLFPSFSFSLFILFFPLSPSPSFTLSVFFSLSHSHFFSFFSLLFAPPCYYAFFFLTFSSLFLLFLLPFLLFLPLLLSPHFVFFYLSFSHLYPSSLITNLFSSFFSLLLSFFLLSIPPLNIFFFSFSFSFLLALILLSFLISLFLPPPCFSSFSHSRLFLSLFPLSLSPFSYRSFLSSFQLCSFFLFLTPHSCSLSHLSHSRFISISLSSSSPLIPIFFFLPPLTPPSYSLSPFSLIPFSFPSPFSPHLSLPSSLLPPSCSLSPFSLIPFHFLLLFSPSLSPFPLSYLLFIHLLSHSLFISFSSPPLLSLPSSCSLSPFSLIPFHFLLPFPPFSLLPAPYPLLSHSRFISFSLSLLPSPSFLLFIPLLSHSLFISFSLPSFPHPSFMLFIPLLSHSLFHFLLPFPLSLFSLLPFRSQHHTQDGTVPQGSVFSFPSLFSLLPALYPLLSRSLFISFSLSPLSPPCSFIPFSLIPFSFPSLSPSFPHPSFMLFIPLLSHSLFISFSLSLLPSPLLPTLYPPFSLIPFHFLLPSPSPFLSFLLFIPFSLIPVFISLSRPPFLSLLPALYPPSLSFPFHFLLPFPPFSLPPSFSSARSATRRMEQFLREWRSTFTHLVMQKSSTSSSNPPHPPPPLWSLADPT